MQAVLLENNVVKNILVIDEINFAIMRNRGMNLFQDHIGLSIDDYTEDGVIFYRDVPIYNEETGERIGVEKTQLNEGTAEDEMREALTILGIEVE